MTAGSEKFTSTRGVVTERASLMSRPIHDSGHAHDSITRWSFGRVAHRILVDPAHNLRRRRQLPGRGRAHSRAGDRAGDRARAARDLPVVDGAPLPRGMAE